MTVQENVFTMTFTGKQKIANLEGKKVIYEKYFDIEKIGTLDRESHKISLIAELEYLNLFLPPISEESLLTIKEASKKYGLTVKQLKELCQSGELSCITKGRSWFILRRSLEKYFG
jgi:hypothetical protein